VNERGSVERAARLRRNFRIDVQRFVDGPMSAAPPSVAVAGTLADLVFWFDCLSIFERRLHAAGWIVSLLPDISVVSLVLSLDAHRTLPLESFGLESPDLALHFGARHGANRFDEFFELDELTLATFDPVLRVTLSDGRTIDIQNPSLQCASADPLHRLTQKFIERIRKVAPGTVLEIGSRQVVGASLKHHFSSDWVWVGADVHDGPGVDMVVDAHELSRVFPREHFDAVVSLAVFEHVLMPWKVAIELNRVMKTGGLGFIVAPPAWPAHEEPWDYWRYSAHSFAALFNAATGFEILEAQQGEPAALVAHRVHGAVNFAPRSVCYLMAAVLFRKIGTTNLEWPVPLQDIVKTTYPK
jgi:hypothetical protein